MRDIQHYCDRCKVHLPSDMFGGFHADLSGGASNPAYTNRPYDARIRLENLCAPCFDEVVAAATAFQAFAQGDESLPALPAGPKAESWWRKRLPFWT